MRDGVVCPVSVPPKGLPGEGLSKTFLNEVTSREL